MNDTVKNVKQTNKGGFFKRLIRESLIFSCLNKLSERISRLFSSGILYIIFLGSDEADKLLENGAIGRFISKINIGQHFIRPFKVFFSNGIEKSKASVIYRYVIKIFLSLSIRSLGVLFSTIGVYGIGIYIAKIFSYITVLPNESEFFWSAFLIITGIPMLLSGKSIADSLKTSRFFNWLFIDLLGINEMTLQSRNKPVTYGTAAFVLGTLLGLVTIFISPLVVILTFLICCICAVIVYTPEFGLLAAILLFPLVSVKILAEIIIVTTISYLIKVMRGKRNLKFRTADIFILLFTVFMLSVGFTGDGGQVRALYLICFIAVYFIISNLIVSRRLIRQAIYSLCTGAVAACILYILQYIIGEMQNDFLSAHTDIIELSLIGRDSFGYFMVLMLPATLALFKVTERKNEKASLLVLLFLIITCIVVEADSGFLIAAYAATFVYFLFETKKTVSTFLRFTIITLLLKISVPFIPFISRIFSESNATLLHGEVNQLIFKNLFTGVGMGDHNLIVALNNIGVSNYIGSLSLFERIVAEGGIFFLLAFLVSVFFILQKAFYGLTKCKKYKMDKVAAAFATIIIMFLILGLFYDMWEDIRIYMLFWIVCGMISAHKNVYGRFVYLKEVKDNE